MGVHREKSEGGWSGAIRRSRVLLRWFVRPDGAVGEREVWEIGRLRKWFRFGRLMVWGLRVLRHWGAYSRRRGASSPLVGVDRLLPGLDMETGFQDFLGQHLRDEWGGAGR